MVAGVVRFVVVEMELQGGSGGCAKVEAYGWAWRRGERIGRGERGLWQNIGEAPEAEMRDARILAAIRTGKCAMVESTYGDLHAVEEPGTALLDTANLSTMVKGGHYTLCLGGLKRRRGPNSERT